MGKNIDQRLLAFPWMVFRVGSESGFFRHVEAYFLRLQIIINHWQPRDKQCFPLSPDSNPGSLAKNDYWRKLSPVVLEFIVKIIGAWNSLLAVWVKRIFNSVGGSKVYKMAFVNFSSAFDTIPRLKIFDGSSSLRAPPWKVGWWLSLMMNRISLLSYIAARSFPPGFVTKALLQVE